VRIASSDVHILYSINSEAAFDYHFGLLDNSNDELGNAYANLTYVKMFLVSTFVKPLRSFHVFGSLTEADILKQFIIALIPKPIIHYITAKSSNPRLVQLRRTSNIASGVAKRLIEEKAKALLDGKGNRDVLTLLGGLTFLI
jgi:hypothetical protein